MIESGQDERIPYLLLLARPSASAGAEAARYLREAGMRVLAQYGTVALEALATADEARGLEDIGLFSAVLSGPMKQEHFQRLGDEQRAIVQQWNTRFGSGYRRGREKQAHLRGRSWGDPELDAPGPFSAIDPEDFFEFLADYERRTGKRVEPKRRGGSGRPRGPMTGEEVQALERQLAEKYGDETIAYHLARLAARLTPAQRHILEGLDEELIQELLAWFFREEACWRMTGEQAVGIVFVESSRSGGPRFGSTERVEICQEIIDGLNWLASEHPGANLSWVYDFQFLRIDVPDGDASDANCPSFSSLEADWRNPAMAEVSYAGNTYSADWASVAEYREDMRTANRSRHAIVIFVTPYANCWHAYAGGGRVVLARHNDWGGWGRHTLDTITAHEVGHLYGTADEYGGSGSPCSTCSSLHGCDQIPNGNCSACARPHQPCMMDQNTRRICPWSRGHVGWAQLFVELTTGDVNFAGTDDDVWLDIGDRVFELDTSGHDDRERNNRDGYPLWVPDLACSEVQRVLIRKSPDGWFGGWRLHQVKLWCRGTVVCDSIVDRWLENDDRVWVGCTTDSDVVNRLQARIATADVAWAGTDDDVTLTLAGRNWNLDNPWHDDFERGSTDSFDLDPGAGLHLSDLHQVRIHKSPDGFAGGWKLKGVELIVNGTTIFNNQSINRWLEDDDRTWSTTF
jgi:PLAT/LH2 domain